MKVLKIFFFVFTLSALILSASCTLESAERTDKSITGRLPVNILEPGVEEFPAAFFTPVKTYYVDCAHPAAGDSNPGSAVLPWKTIRHAAKTVSGNNRIIVKAGTYNERVTVSHSGLQDGFLIFEASGDVRMKGFLLYGNYLAVIGFIITGTPADYGWLNGGFWLSGHYQSIKRNRIYNFVNAGGIVPSWANEGSWDNIQIIENYISGCNAGIEVYGRNWLVRGNEVHRLIRGEPGRDADYMRFFGDNLVIKNNYFHGTELAEIGASHVDVFQTFYQNGGFAYNVLIERNIATGFYHQGLMAEASDGSHVNIIVRHNVFAHASAWGICAQGIDRLSVENNTFYYLNTHGVGFRNSRSGSSPPAGTSGSVKNNIFMHVSANSAYWRETGCEYFAGYNLIFPAAHQSYAATDIVDKAPLFINPGNIAGPDNVPFTADDGLRLQAGSPACSTGEGGVNVGAY